MNPFENIRTLSSIAALSESPVMRMIRQQQEIREKFQSLIGQYNGGLQYAEKLADLSKLTGFSALRSLQQMAIDFPQTRIEQLNNLGAAFSQQEQIRALGSTLQAANQASLLNMPDSALLNIRQLRILNSTGLLPTLAAIPPGTMESITNLASSQSKLKTIAAEMAASIVAKGNMFQMGKGLGYTPFSLDFTTLSRILADKAFEFTSEALVGQSWEAIEDLNAIHDQVIDATQTVIEPNEDFEKAFAALRSLIEDTISFIRRYSKTLSSASLFTFTIFMYGADLHQYWSFLNEEKQQFASQKDMHELTTKVELLRQDLNKIVPYKIVTRDCWVYLKPKFKSRRLNKISPGTEVVLLDTHSKWAYVSFQDENDGFQQSGWVPKKYLIKK